MDIAEAFGQVLRRLRIAEGLTQEELALRAGVTTNTISKLELGKNQPMIGTMIHLANALNIAPHDLLQLTVCEHRKP